MPTIYPKASVTEMVGLLVLLAQHKGSDDVARLADDLDLEIDEILPSLEFAEVLALVTVSDGQATLTDLGRRFLAAPITGRKSIIREELRKTTLFRTLLRALESHPAHQLTEEELYHILSFTSAPADEVVQNIVNWGRYAELFRYSPETHVLAMGRRAQTKTGPGASRPPPPPSGEPPATTRRAPTPAAATSPSERAASAVVAAA